MTKDKSDGNNKNGAILCDLRSFSSIHIRISQAETGKAKCSTGGKDTHFQ